LYGEVGDE